MFLIFCPWSETHLREAVVAGWWGLVLGLAGERALAGWDRICWSLSKMDMWWRLQTFILATTGPRTKHRTPPRSGSSSCWTRLINNLIAPPRFALKHGSHGCWQQLWIWIRWCGGELIFNHFKKQFGKSWISGVSFECNLMICGK